MAALLLASVGLYGLVSLAVAARTREIGVRMALRARAGQIAGHVVGRVASLLTAGAAAGLILTLLADRVLRFVLFGVSPMDRRRIGTGNSRARRRAARIDPLEAIRTE